MVYVPDGSFWLGNNGSTTNTTLAYYKMGSPATSYDITSEASISNSGTWGANGLLILPERSNDAVTYTIPAAFPKGYNGFYCMKYEASQQHWVDYLNTLTAAQQANMPTVTQTRNGISVSAGVYSTTLPFVAMNGVVWPHVAAYLDWAGLRVMSEFEFEKACRGPQSPVTDEFAWGNTSLTNHNGTFTNSGLTSEVSAAAGANTNLSWTTTTGSNPLRCGSFATSSSTRVQAGASYYGIMELTGSLWESVATPINTQKTNTTYSGLHGDGILTSVGYADVSNWPGLSSGFISSTGVALSAIGLKGGSWYTSSINHGRIADRAYNPVSVQPTSNPAAFPNYAAGIRGVHTKPITASETK
jgi:hypothetical protein